MGSPSKDPDVRFLVQVTLAKSVFEGNTVAGATTSPNELSYNEGGGAVYINGGDDSSCKLVITSSTFSGNSKFGNGGLLLASGMSDCAIDSSTFKQESSINGFGGVAMLSSTAGLKLTKSGLNGKQAVNGGGIHFSGSEVSFLHPRLIVANSVTRIAARCSMCEFVQVSVEGSTFGGFSAVEKGGALYLNEVPDVSLTSTSFTSNKAGQGGGVFVSGSSSATISGGVFSENKGTNQVRRWREINR